MIRFNKPNQFSLVQQKQNLKTAKKQQVSFSGGFTADELDAIALSNQRIIELRKPFKQLVTHYKALLNKEGQATFKKFLMEYITGFTDRAKSCGDLALDHKRFNFPKPGIIDKVKIKLSRTTRTSDTAKQIFFEKLETAGKGNTEYKNLFNQLLEINKNSRKSF